MLFDQGTPVPLRKHLATHKIETAYERGWSALKNGDLLSQAESVGFDVRMTTDQNLRYQQNLTGRNIAIVVLGSTSWPRIQKILDTVSAAVEASGPGSDIEVDVPGGG